MYVCQCGQYSIWSFYLFCPYLINFKIAPIFFFDYSSIINRKWIVYLRSLNCYAKDKKIKIHFTWTVEWEYFFCKTLVVCFIELLLPKTTIVVLKRMEITYSQMPTICSSSSIIQTIILVWIPLMKRSIQAQISCIHTIIQVYPLQLLNILNMGRNQQNHARCHYAKTAFKCFLAVLYYLIGYSYNLFVAADYTWNIKVFIKNMLDEFCLFLYCIKY